MTDKDVSLSNVKLVTPTVYKIPRSLSCCTICLSPRYIEKFTKDSLVKRKMTARVKVLLGQDTEVKGRFICQKCSTFLDDIHTFKKNARVALALMDQLHSEREVENESAVKEEPVDLDTDDEETDDTAYGAMYEIYDEGDFNDPTLTDESAEPRGQRGRRRGTGRPLGRPVKRRSFARRAADSDEVQCDACRRSFVNNEMLRNHHELCIRKAGRPGAYRCDICEKRFCEPSRLYWHKQQAHNAARPFECTVCMKAFKEDRHLRRHMTVHTGEKNFSCEVCEKRFSSEAHVTQHMVVHSTDRAFSCDVCEATFTCERYLTAHTLKVHRMTYPGSEDNKCPKCDESFLRDDTLRNHVELCGIDQPMVSCRGCGELFKNRGNLLYHETNNLCPLRNGTWSAHEKEAVNGEPKKEGTKSTTTTTEVIYHVKDNMLHLEDSDGPIQDAQLVQAVEQALKASGADTSGHMRVERSDENGLVFYMDPTAPTEQAVAMGEEAEDGQGEVEEAVEEKTVAVEATDETDQQVLEAMETQDN